MRGFLRSRQMPVGVAVAIVVFAFWRALLAGGSLVPVDVAAAAPPFDAYRSASFSAEVGPGEPASLIDGHAHWAALADDVRSGDFAWWNTRLGGGEPTMKAGVPVFSLPYLVVPSWFAPGLVAAIRVLTAIGLMFGLLRSTGAQRMGALVGGIAFGFSGFMVGWTNSPVSSVAALAPGWMWAIEAAIRDPRPRRAAPIAAVVAAMVWSAAPAITGYVLFGGVVYTLVRLLVSFSGRRDPRWYVSLASTLGLAGLLALGLAAPHLLGVSDYRDWTQAPSGPRMVDTSAGVEYLLTAFAPSVWGSDVVSAQWFGEGSWGQFNTHLGTSVVLLALVGIGLGMADRTRRSVTAAFSALVALGVLVAYVGGPVSVAIDSLVGDNRGAMTHARVLIAMGMAALAGLAVDRWTEVWNTGDRPAIRAALLWAAGFAAVVSFAMVPSAKTWFHELQAAGATKQVVAASTASLLALGACLGVGFARWKRWITPDAAGWVVLAAVTFELLLFAMPVPTIVGRHERLEATPAHQAVVAALEPGERLGSQGQTFFPNTTAQFGIDHVGANTEHPSAYRELLASADTDNPADPAWESLAVGVWAQNPDQTPIGVLDKPPIGTSQLDPGVAEVHSVTAVPEGGLRAIVLDAAMPEPSFVTVIIEVGGDTHVDRRWRDRADWSFVPISLVGEHYEPGAPIEVSITSSREGAVVVSSDAAGAAVLGTIAGGDRYRLIRSGDVLLTEIIDSSFVRATPGAQVVDSTVGPDVVTALVDADGEALVTVAINHHPGWSAQVDGEEVGIVRADSAFMGVEVGPGRHSIELTFTPKGLRSRLAVFLVSILGISLLWFGPRFPAAGRGGR
ncbi:MAG: YfhO family protein [Actinobacteria bacterium]|nr:YfhO family protein [Actinomycetota bacterium]